MGATRAIKVFCYANMTLGKPLDNLTMGTGCQGTNKVIGGLEHSVPSPDLWGGEKGWGLNSVTMVNDLINHAYVMEPP